MLFYEATNQSLTGRQSPFLGNVSFALTVPPHWMCCKEDGLETANAQQQFSHGYQTTGLKVKTDALP